MGLTVNTNVASLTAVNNLSQTTRALSKSFARVSSGKRITSAADDAAGAAVAANLDAQLSSIDAAKRNTNDGIGVIQIAEGATSEVGDILKRMRELAVQSSSETLDTTERAYLDDEVDQLKLEVDRIAAVTEFNGVALTDGTNASLDVQVGLDGTANSTVTVTLGDISQSGLTITAVDVGTSANAKTAIGTLDTAIDTLNGMRSDYGSSQNRLDSSLRSLETYGQNLSGAMSRIVDADFAAEAAELSKNQIMQQAGLSILAQANGMNQGAVRLIG